MFLGSLFSQTIPVIFFFVCYLSRDLSNDDDDDHTKYQIRMPLVVITFSFSSLSKAILVTAELPALCDVFLLFVD